jgi:hypothetical protein
MIKEIPMQRRTRSGVREIGKGALIGALCLAAISARAQTSIDTAFARKLYSAGHDDLFHVGVGLKNAGSGEAIDTAKTDAFFRRHEIKATADAKTFLSKPPAYARTYELYISPTEVLFFMEDTLVESLVDLGTPKPVSLEGGKIYSAGKRASAARPMGAWLLGRMIGPRPSALLHRP